MLPRPPKWRSPFCVLHPTTPSPLTAFPQQSSLRSPFHTLQHHGVTGDPSHPQGSVVSLRKPAPRAPGWLPRDNGHHRALGTGLMRGVSWRSQENREMPVPQPGWPMWNPLATLCQLPRGVVCHDSREPEPSVRTLVLPRRFWGECGQLQGAKFGGELQRCSTLGLPTADMAGLQMPAELDGRG